MKTLAFTAGLALFGTFAAPATAQPNLMASINLNNGTVSVQNVGFIASGASVVTVECFGNCPEPNPAQVAPYLDPAFPNRLAIDLPPIQPGATANHVISFWNALAFTPGQFNMIVCADAGNDVVEASERDNCNQNRKSIKARPGLKAPRRAKPAGVPLKLKARTRLKLQSQ